MFKCQYGLGLGEVQSSLIPKRRARERRHALPDTASFASVEKEGQGGNFVVGTCNWHSSLRVFLLGDPLPPNILFSFLSFFLGLLGMANLFFFFFPAGDCACGGGGGLVTVWAARIKSRLRCSARMRSVSASRRATSSAHLEDSASSSSLVLLSASSRSRCALGMLAAPAQFL